MGTKYSDINLTTSVAVYFAQKLNESGWRVYWQSTDTYSGVATLGTVTIVPELPNEPEFIVLPPRNRTAEEVVVPVFSVNVSQQPKEESLEGLGSDIFEEKASLVIQGFCADRSQHMAFATMFRNFFRPEFRVIVRDFETNPTDPPIVDDTNTVIDSRSVERLDFTDLPQPVRYYLNAEINITFFD